MSGGLPSWATPGRKVVFLGHRKPTTGNVILLDAGAVYTLRETFQNSVTTEWGARIVEVRNGIFPSSGKEYGYPLVSFRPAVEPKSEAEDAALFSQHLTQRQPEGVA